MAEAISAVCVGDHDVGYVVARDCAPMKALARIASVGGGTMQGRLDMEQYINANHDVMIGPEYGTGRRESVGLLAVSWRCESVWMGRRG